VTAELGFVLAVAVMSGVAAAVLGGREEPRSWDRTRAGLGVAACALGLVIIRFGGVFDATSRARALLAVGGVVVGVGAALISAEVREYFLSDVRGLKPAASPGLAPLAIVGGVSAILMMLVTRANAFGAVATLFFAFAFGGAVGTLLGSRAGDPFPLLAIATATMTYACVTVAMRNGAAFRDFHRSALIALGPLSPLLASVALAVGARSVRSDAGEGEDVAIVRGFAVATIVGMLGVVAASHWWARPSGRGAWLSLPAIAAAVGSVVVLLLGRYYDDPELRAGRAIARARRGGPITRRRVGARIGAEGALAVIAVAAAVALAASYAADVLAIEAGRALGVAVAVAATLASFAFLDAVAGGRDARTLAHDVLLVALCAGALLSRGVVALAAAPIALVLVLAGVLERVAAASDEEADELRKQAAILPVVAAGILAAAATFAGVIGDA
jgi:hypothetical protein